MNSSSPASASALKSSFKSSSSSTSYPSSISYFERRRLQIQSAVSLTPTKSSYFSALANDPPETETEEKEDATIFDEVQSQKVESSVEAENNSFSSNEFIPDETECTTVNCDSVPLVTFEDCESEANQAPSESCNEEERVDEQVSEKSDAESEERNEVDEERESESESESEGEGEEEPEEPEEDEGVVSDLPCALKDVLVSGFEELMEGESNDQLTGEVETQRITTSPESSIPKETNMPSWLFIFQQRKKAAAELARAKKEEEERLRFEKERMEKIQKLMERLDQEKAERELKKQIAEEEKMLRKQRRKQEVQEKKLEMERKGKERAQENFIIRQQKLKEERENRKQEAATKYQQKMELKKELEDLTQLSIHHPLIYAKDKEANDKRLEYLTKTVKSKAIIEEENERKLFVGNVLFDDLKRNCTNLQHKVDTDRLLRLVTSRHTYLLSLFSMYGGEELEEKTFFWDKEMEKGHYFLTFKSPAATSLFLSNFKNFEFRKKIIKKLTEKIITLKIPIIPVGKGPKWGDKQVTGEGMEQVGLSTESEVSKSKKLSRSQLKKLQERDEDVLSIPRMTFYVRWTNAKMIKDEEANQKALKILEGTKSKSKSKSNNEEGDWQVVECRKKKFGKKVKKGEPKEEEKDNDENDIIENNNEM